MRRIPLPQKRPTGLTAYAVFVVGQVISLMGSSMTLFAANLWAWETTGKATTLSLSTLAGFAPTIFLIPVAGALVDRWNRKVVMMMSDLGAGLATGMLLLLLSTGRLQVWHLYVANALSGIFGAFQFPAASAAMTLIVPKAQYGRANGLMWLTTPAANIFSPILAAALLAPLGFAGIMIIDIATCLIAVGLLLFIEVPTPPRSAAGRAGEGHLLHEIIFGFRYIFDRPSLLGIQLIFFAKNLFSNPAYMILVAPMILARTGNDKILLGTVMSAGAIGGLVGGVVLSAWGGPKRRIHGVLAGMIALYLFGQTAMALGRSLWIWSAAGFLVAFFLPIINGANQAIWQAKVPPDIQGRVFASRRLIAQFPTSFAMLFIGPLADRVFEPAMAPGGLLVPWLGRWLGAGPGAGMALILLIGAIVGVLIGAGGYLYPGVRNAEDILPDYDKISPES